MARRADDYLGEQLLQIDRHPGPYEDAALRFGRHALAAFREIGLLGPDEADAWDGRLARATEDPIDRRPLPPEARVAAHRYLEGLVAERASDTQHDVVAPARVDAAIRALADIGALSPGEAAQWSERAFPPPPDVAVLPRCDKTHMVRVMHGPNKLVDGLQLTLIELYTDGVTLNWHEQRALLGERAMRRIRRLLDQETADLAHPSLTDEVGTAYAFCGGSGGHGNGDRATIGYSDFAPTPPPAAPSLVFESLGRQIRITLDA
jgi:hypothetical protein